MNKNNLPEEAKTKQIERMPHIKKIAVVLIAIIGGFMLWIYAIGYDSTMFERTFDGVEVVVEGEEALAANKGYTLAENQKFSSVTIVARGKRSELNALSSSDFRAVIDVSQSENAGNQTLNIVVYSPNGIEVVHQSSTTATVFVDEFTQRNELVSVSVETGSNYIMAEGVTFVNAVANPLTVLVSGPASVLDSIGGAYVKFSLDGHTVSENIYGYGAIELRDKNGNVIENPYVTVSESTAYVAVSVTKQKVVPVRVSFSGGIFDPKDVSVETSLGYITVSGSPDMVDSLDEIKVTVDETTINGSADYEFSIASLLPSGISNESGVSKLSVKVTLPKLALRGYRISAEKINVINLPEGMTYKINNALDVNLIGPREEFDNVDRDALTATVDFDNVTVEPDGSYTAPAVISLGNEYNGIYVQNIGYAVNFSLENT